MKLVYVAGPYRATTIWGVEQNIQRAQHVGAQVLRVPGLYPVIPHMNTRHMEGIVGDEHVLAGTLEMLRRCDAVILVGDWERSTGTRGEVDEALRLGLPVLYAWGDESYSADILRSLAAGAVQALTPGTYSPYDGRYWLGSAERVADMLRFMPNKRAVSP